MALKYALDNLEFVPEETTDKRESWFVQSGFLGFYSGNEHRPFRQGLRKSALLTLDLSNITSQIPFKRPKYRLKSISYQKWIISPLTDKKCK